MAKQPKEIRIVPPTFDPTPECPAPSIEEMRPWLQRLHTMLDVYGEFRLQGESPSEEEDDRAVRIYVTCSEGHSSELYDDFEFAGWDVPETDDPNNWIVCDIALQYRGGEDGRTIEAQRLYLHILDFIDGGATVLKTFERIHTHLSQYAIMLPGFGMGGAFRDAFRVLLKGNGLD